MADQSGGEKAWAKQPVASSSSGGVPGSGENPSSVQATNGLLTSDQLTQILAGLGPAIASAVTHAQAPLIAELRTLSLSGTVEDDGDLGLPEGPYCPTLTTIHSFHLAVLLPLQIYLRDPSGTVCLVTRFTPFSQPVPTNQSTPQPRTSTVTGCRCCSTSTTSRVTWRQCLATPTRTRKRFSTPSAPSPRCWASV